LLILAQEERFVRIVHERRETWTVPLRNIGELALMRALRY